MPSKPNILLILTDDQGWQDLGCFGHPYVKTPCLDQLAAQGTALHSFYVSSPVCSPSRTTFLTGCYPARHNVHHIFRREPKRFLMRDQGVPPFLDPSISTVARAVQQVGYRTAHIGKWHLGGVPEAPSPARYGFDHYRVVAAADQHTAWPKPAKTPGWWANSTDLFVDEVIRFIDEKPDLPFYINLWTLIPHAPLNPTPEQLELYRDLVTNPGDFQGWMREYFANAAQPDEQMKVWCASLTALDQAIGRLLDHLDQTGLADNTIVFYTSDNGPEDYRVANAANAGVGSPYDGRARKRSLYEGGVHVPAIARWPAHIPAGSVNHRSLIGSIDWFPTVCAWTGAPLPQAPLDGEDVSDILAGHHRNRINPLFWEWRYDVAGDSEYRPPSLAIRSGSWKLLMNADGTHARLFNIDNDPGELIDRSRQEPEIMASLSELLLRWKATLPERHGSYEGVVDPMD